MIISTSIVIILWIAFLRCDELNNEYEDIQKLLQSLKSKHSLKDLEQTTESDFASHTIKEALNSSFKTTFLNSNSDEVADNTKEKRDEPESFESDQNATNLIHLDSTKPPKHSPANSSSKSEFQSTSSAEEKLRHSKSKLEDSIAINTLNTAIKKETFVQLEDFQQNSNYASESKSNMYNLAFLLRLYISKYKLLYPYSLERYFFNFAYNWGKFLGKKLNENPLWITKNDSRPLMKLIRLILASLIVMGYILYLDCTRLRSSVNQVTELHQLASLLEKDVTNNFKKVCELHQDINKLASVTQQITKIQNSLNNAIDSLKQHFPEENVSQYNIYPREVEYSEFGPYGSQFDRESHNTKYPRKFFDD